MNRLTVTLLAALDALVAVAIGIGVCVVPLTVLWAVHYGVAGGPGPFWTASASIWLLGHGVDLTIALPAGLAATLGVPAAATNFTVTIAAAGFSLATLLVGGRIGARAERAGHPYSGGLAGVIVYAILGVVIGLGAHTAVVSAPLWQAVLLPALVLAVGEAAGILLAVSGRQQTDAVGRERVGADGLGARWHALDARVRDGATQALRAGSAATLLLVAAAALVCCLSLAVHFGQVIGLYESLQAGALGGAVLTLAQLALIPNAVVWTMGWLVGPGFAIGTGSSVSPVGTQLGPLPELPLLGAIPHGDLLFGFLGVLLPVAAGIAAGVLVRWRTRMPVGGDRSAVWIAATAAGIGVVAGVLVGAMTWWAAGSAGPGRLADVGGDGLLTGAVAALEIAVGAAVGLALHARVRSVVGRARPAHPVAAADDETSARTADEANGAPLI